VSEYGCSFGGKAVYRMFILDILSVSFWVFVRRQDTLYRMLILGTPFEYQNLGWLPPKIQEQGENFQYSVEKKAMFCVPLGI